MRHWGKKLTTLALIFVLALSVCPLGYDGAQAAGAYGKTTANSVKVRKKASTSVAYWFELDAGYVCQVLDVVPGNITWYKVRVEHPDPGTERYYTGYIHGDFFTLLSDEEAAAYEAGKLTDEPTQSPTSETTAATATPAPSGNTTAYLGATGQITNDGVNFRESEGGGLIAKLNRNTVVEILTIPATVDTNHWYKVRYDGKEGFIMSTYLKVISTGDPNATATPPGTVVSSRGYVKLLTTSANLRLTPAGTIAAQWTNQGEVLEIADTPVEYGEITWYPVDYNGSRYYVREDTVQVQATPGSSSTATQEPTAVIGYIRTTDRGVNLRLTPAGTIIERVTDKGTVLPLLAEPVKQGSIKWYYVQTSDGSRGYLHGNYVTLCNADGSDISTETEAPAVTATPTQTPAQSYGYVKTIKVGVNVRTKPTGSSQEQVAIGTVLTLIGEPDTTSSPRYTWYPVRTPSGITGVVRGDCVQLCNADGTDIGSVPTNTPTASPDTSTQPTATPAPTTTVSPFGYVQITKTDVALRKTVGGSVLTRLSKGTVWPMTAGVVTKNGVKWYPIEANGYTGYVRGDCCSQLTANQLSSWLAGNGIPEEVPEEKVQYVITTLDKVNLRAAATKDATAKFNVPQGTVMAYKQAPTGASNWYKVIYENTEVWVLGTCVKEMTADEYNTWAEANPNNTPQTEVIAGYVKTTDSGVNLRKTANGTVITQLAKGSVYSYSKTETKGKKTWYYVKTDSGYGYVHGDYVIECNADGSSFTPGSTTTPSTSGQEASYTTLKLGSQGAAVTNLVQELINQGYYTGDVTSKYTSSVQAAVKAFQSAKNLTVDGIAGSKTQHALFGTVPIGSGDSSNLTMTIYPVEKIDWFTGGIQQLWPKGANYKIYDVKTGIVWWAHRWSGAYHADIEPLTAADTARLCKIYGVNDAQEIYDKNLWQRRPCLVTIGTRTFACSLDGMPHNPDGDTIPDNNMTGQICLHFTNSKGHESGAVSTSHAEAIEYAYTHAPNGQKK